MSARSRERAELVKREEEKREERSDEEEDYEEAVREFSSSTFSRRKPEPPRLQIIHKVPEAVDDFLRNFLHRLGLKRTLSSFEAEWYGSAQRLQTESLRMTSADVSFIPDALTHRQVLLSELQEVHKETQLLREEALIAGESLVRMRREKDFHQLQYRRIQEEKKQLMEDLKKLNKHLESYEPALKQLDDKYQTALRHKMLISLEKDRAKNTTNQEKSPIKSERSITSSDKPKDKSTITKPPKKTEFPDPHLAQGSFQTCKSSFSLSSSIRAHDLPISCIDLHPHKLILATASDDQKWRLWALPADGEKVGQMVLTGDGHSDWLSGCCFHPDGMKLATTSGDTTVRLWDFSHGSCVLTLSGHSQPTWGCSFHSCGHVLASCSVDRTIKLWDVKKGCCQLTLRRHTASVNSVCFLPFSDLLLSCSADKSLAMWDARLGVCVATFQGHQHPCNHVAFSLAGNITASCDSGGIVNLWDIRKLATAVASVDGGPSANQVAFNPPGRILAVACSDTQVKLVDMNSLGVSSLLGHSDDVQSVTFDHKGETLISAGSDGMVKVWS